MSKMNTNIKCSKCGVFTENSDYCRNCGNLISHRKRQELKVAQFRQEQIDEVKKELENPNLAKRLIEHPFVLYRVAGWVLHSVFLVVSAIGAFLAWFIAMVAAG